MRAALTAHGAAELLSPTRLVLRPPPSRGTTSRTRRRSPSRCPPRTAPARAAATARVVVRPIAGRVSLSGALLDNAREAKVRDDSDYVLALTLTDDAWAPALRASEGYASVVEASAEAALLARELLLGVASLNSSSSYTFQSTGWDDVVLDGLRPDHVTVVTNTTLEIALPPFPAYAIDEPETIAVAVPAAALASRAPLGHAPSFVVAAAAGEAALFGDFLGHLTESGVAAETGTLTIRLYDDNFVDEIGGDNDATRALLEQLRSEQSENNGWNGRVFPFIDADSVTRRSSTEVDVAIPAGGAFYQIATPETIRLEPPASVLKSALPLRRVDPPSSSSAPTPAPSTCRGRSSSRRNRSSPPARRATSSWSS